MDIFALTNSAINFMIYCSMSRQFRAAFQKIFRLNLVMKWIPIAQHSPEENGSLTQVTHV